MRIFRKIFEDSKVVRYEYLYNDHKRPFSGLVEIDKDLATKKDSACIKVIKPADKEWSPNDALLCAVQSPEIFRGIFFAKFTFPFSGGDTT